MSWLPTCTWLDNFYKAKDLIDTFTDAAGVVAVFIEEKNDTSIRTWDNLTEIKSIPFRSKTENRVGK